MSVTYGIVWRIWAISGLTLWPGSCPPSPGLAPCAILICSSSAFTRYSVVAPKRAEATCRIRDRMLSPFGSGMFRSGSSPPSPELLRPPIWFIAMAIVSWVSLLMEPNDIAAVTKRGDVVRLHQQGDPRDDRHRDEPDRRTEQLRGRGRGSRTEHPAPERGQHAVPDPAGRLRAL